MLHYNKIKMDNRQKIKIIISREGKALDHSLNKVVNKERKIKIINSLGGKALDNSLNKVVNKVQAEEVVEEI